jgi:hypothetical protein
MLTKCEYCNTSLQHQTPVESDGKEYCDRFCVELANRRTWYSTELSLSYEGQQLELTLNRKERDLSRS